VRVPLVGLLGAAFAACAAASCIASFDEASAPGCDGGSCADARPPDATFDRREVGQETDAHKVDAGEKLEAAIVEASPCKGVVDGGACGAGDPCHEPPICLDGVCTPQVRANGTPCGIPLDACHSIPSCKDGACGASTALTDGTQWEAGNDNARCCGGKEVLTTSVTNCGVCDIKCNTKLGQKCTAVDGHYFCTPCAVGQCWSGCCSDTITSHCSPSDCSTGACASPTVCPDGSHCQSDEVNYCSY
jgi:hypothetical protein